MKGLQAPAIKNKIALRASVTGSVFMDSVKVSHDHLLPKSLGLGSAFSCLNSARYDKATPSSISIANILTKLRHFLGRDGCT